MQHSRLPLPRLWLFSGTGEGPLLARALLRRGWGLRVQVVTGEAARAYGADAALQLAVGALDGGAVAAEILRARRQGEPYHWLVDGSHPFATRITQALADTCGALAQPLLRLQRPLLMGPQAQVCADTAALAAALRPGERVLLALGARHLPGLLAALPPIEAHARLLPRPAALRLALAAGLPAGRVACLQPAGAGAIERALCRRWRIQTVVCRQSGGLTERLWRRVCRSEGCRLLLLARPAEPAGVEALPLAALLARLGVPAEPPAWAPSLP